MNELFRAAWKLAIEIEESDTRWHVLAVERKATFKEPGYCYEVQVFPIIEGQSYFNKTVRVTTPEQWYKLRG